MICVHSGVGLKNTTKIGHLQRGRVGMDYDWHVRKLYSIKRGDVEKHWHFYTKGKGEMWKSTGIPRVEIRGLK